MEKKKVSRYIIIIGIVLAIIILLNITFQSGDLYWVIIDIIFFSLIGIAFSAALYRWTKKDYEIKT